MQRNKTKIIKFLEIEELKELEKPLYERAKKALQNKNMSIPDKIAVRDFVIVNLVYAGALRISEACNLELKDLDIEHKQIYVFNGKGGDRIVPLPDQAIELIKIWLQIRPEWKNNNYLFTNVKGTTRPGKTRPINQKYFNQLFEKLANETGIKLRDGSLPHPHTLRHSRAMELYDNVGDLQLIQALLGHKNIATTQIYAQVRDEKVAEMQKAITGGLINL